MKKNNKGFTLVELIVVLVILGILMALLIPALTGYIDKAKYSKGEAQASMVVKAAKSAYAEFYASKEASQSWVLSYSNTTAAPGEPAVTKNQKFFKAVNEYLKGDIRVSNIIAMQFTKPAGKDVVFLLQYKYSDEEDGIIYFCEGQNGTSIMTNDQDEFSEFYYNNSGIWGTR